MDDNVVVLDDSTHGLVWGLGSFFTSSLPIREVGIEGEPLAHKPMTRAENVACNAA